MEGSPSHKRSRRHLVTPRAKRDISWVAETPLFDVRRWIECPRHENVMDLRQTDNYLILTTAGWESDSPIWSPHPPQSVSRSCRMTHCCHHQSSDRRSRSLELSGVRGVLISPALRWKYQIPLSPRGMNHLNNAGAAAAIASRTREMTVHQSNNAGTKVSLICIRDVKNSELIQRLQIETPSINCLDGLGGSSNDLVMFINSLIRL